MNDETFSILGACSEGDETDEELLETLNRLDGKSPRYIQMAFKEMREFNVEDTYNHLL